MSMTLPEVRGEYKYDAQLRHLTWFKVGGPAEILYKPLDLEDLQVFLQTLDSQIPYYILGAGSNILVRDGGVLGVVIKLGRVFAEVKLVAPNQIYCGGACLNFNAARMALEHSLSGLEFLVGIPGSIGGGVWMNAGCYGSEFKDVLHEVHLVTDDGAFDILSAEDVNFEYRCSNLPTGSIVVGAVFNLYESNTDAIRSKMNNITEERKSSQPQGVQTGGSTFANPMGNKKAWQLIDSVGLRGYKLGGASFSERHCNFLINDGTATASDIEKLGEEARARIKSQYNIDLHWEIKRIGV